MANTLLNTALISKEALRQWHNNLVFGRTIDYSKSSEFGKGDNKIGTSVRVRRQVLTQVVRNNMSWNPGKSARTQTSVSLVIDSTLTNFMSFSDADLALKLERFSENILKPTIQVMTANYDLGIANAISNSAVGTADFGGTDQFGAAGSASVPGYAGYVVGDFGTAITKDTILAAKTVLVNKGVQQGAEVLGVLSAQANQDLASGQASLFNTFVQDAAEYKEGYIGKFAGIDFSVSNSVASHTNGAAGTLTVTAGELTSGWGETCTLTVSALSGAVNAGDVYQVTGDYVVNAITKVTTPTLFQFTVLQAASSGATSIVTSPIITGGDYQNVSSTVVGKTVTLVGSTGASGQESYIYTKDAIYGAVIELDVPRGKDMAASMRGDDIEDVKIRLIREYDSLGVSGVNGSAPGYVGRLDMAFGIKIVNPDKIVRIRGK